MEEHYTGVIDSLNRVIENPNTSERTRLLADNTLFKMLSGADGPKEDPIKELTPQEPKRVFDPSDSLENNYQRLVTAFNKMTTQTEEDDKMEQIATSLNKLFEEQ